MFNQLPPHCMCCGNQCEISVNFTNPFHANPTAAYFHSERSQFFFSERLLWFSCLHKTYISYPTQKRHNAICCVAFLYLFPIILCVNNSYKINVQPKQPRPKKFQQHGLASRTDLVRRCRRSPPNLFRFYTGIILSDGWPTEGDYVTITVSPSIPALA